MSTSTVQDYRRVPIDDLDSYPGNARRGNLDLIVDSLRRYGQYRPLVVQRQTMRVLAGNHTLAAAVRLGWTHVDATLLDCDDDTAARINLIDNRSNDVAGYDTAALAAQLAGMPDLDGTGWTTDDLAGLLQEIAPSPTALTDEDDAPVPPETPVSRLGDVWQLGPHRVACGDGTDSASVSAALDGQPAGMLFTDPPYGVVYEGKTADKLTIKNDALAEDELHQMLIGMFSAAHKVLRPGGAFYVCSPAGNLETTFRLALRDVSLKLRQQIVWSKNTLVLGRSDYHYQHETILYGWQNDAEPLVPPHFDPEHDTLLYGWKDGAAHTWEGGRKQTTVWEYPKPSRSAVHPTMKPVALVKRAIGNSTRLGEAVLDLCGGSGSTLIACHHTSRVGALVELDPHYVDVICRRYQEHTGTLPIRNGEPVDFTARKAAA